MSGNAAASSDGPDLAVSVAFSPRAGVVDAVAIRIGRGSTLADAIAASGIQRSYPELDLSQLPVGVWGVRCERNRLLRDGDRVELYRPLTVDPKEARRLRYRATAAGRPPA